MIWPGRPKQYLLDSRHRDHWSNDKRAAETVSIAWMPLLKRSKMAR